VVVHHIFLLSLAYIYVWDYIFILFCLWLPCLLLICTAASYFFTYFYALSHSCCTHCFHQTITLFILLCFCCVSVLCWLLLLHCNFLWLLIVAAWSVLACVWTDCTHVGKANIHWIACKHVVTKHVWPYHIYYKQKGSWKNTVELYTYKHSASLHRMLT